MKKLVVAAIALTLSGTIMVAPASSQVEGEDPVIPEETTTTTTAKPAETTTTTTAKPEETTTTTVAGPVEGVTTTTIAEDPVDEGEPGPGVDLDITELPGLNVAAGTLNFAVEFYSSEVANCTGSLGLGGGNLNVVHNEEGNVGALYGVEPTGSGNAGLVMIELGAVPAAVAVLSVSDANCEFDAVGVGNWLSTPTTASLDGVGAGLYPGAYDTGDFISSIWIETEVTKTDGPAALDLEAAEAFLTRSRTE